MSESKGTFKFYGRKKKLICIGGPTASGKTALSLRLARKYQTEIISVDSRQIYKELNIGTAKPSSAELHSITHHFINHVSIVDSYDVGIFEKEALSLLEEKFKSLDVLVAVGGSGLYFKALLEGLDIFPPVQASILHEINQVYQREGIQYLQKKIQEVDPVYYRSVDKNNPVRLIRALSIFTATGKPFSSYRSGRKVERFFEAQCYYLCPDRKWLYEKIDRRVDSMIQEGLVEEAYALQGNKELKALQTVGYAELFKYFSGAYDLNEAITKIKQHSRQYAKRQFTWFNHADNWLKWNDTD